VIIIFPPLHLLSDVLALQTQMEEERLLDQNSDRALELMTRAIQGAGYQAIDRLHRSTPTRTDKDLLGVQIKKGGSRRGSDAIILTQDIPDELGYDCIGNPFSQDRSVQQKTYQHFYIEPSRHDPASQILVCQSLDRHGRLHHAELLNQVDYLYIDWVTTDAQPTEAKHTQSPTGLIRIVLAVVHKSSKQGVSRPSEQIRFIAQRHTGAHQ
jgi:hypothetical protein